MSWFPLSTAVDRIMPKEAFYKRLILSAEVKEKFVTDIKRITLTNSLTATTLNIEPGKEVSEILILTVALKKQEFDGRIIGNIARQNKHQLLFLLHYEDKVQLAVYYGKLYTTEWTLLDNLQIAVKGYTLDDVWHSFLEQIAINTAECKLQITALGIDQRLARQEALRKLQREVEKLEKLTRGEKQPRKKFELYQKMQELKKKLEELTHGQA